MLLGRLLAFSYRVAIWHANVEIWDLARGPQKKEGYRHQIGQVPQMRYPL